MKTTVKTILGASVSVYPSSAFPSGVTVSIVGRGLPEHSGWTAVLDVASAAVIGEALIAEAKAIESKNSSSPSVVEPGGNGAVCSPRKASDPGADVSESLEARQATKLARDVADAKALFCESFPELAP